MRNHMYYYLSDFIDLAKPSDDVINFIIQTKHEYLLIYNDVHECLISNTQYVENSFKQSEDGLFELKISIKDTIYLIDKITDIVGFNSFDVALQFCTDQTDCLCSQPNSKLIFSPQLTKYLLKHNFRIIDIKEKNDGSRDVIHVFQIEPGFYDCIKNWKEERKNNNGLESN